MTRLHRSLTPLEEAFVTKCSIAFIKDPSDTVDLVNEFSELSGEQRITVWITLAENAMLPKGLDFAKFIHRCFASLVLLGIETTSPGDLKAIHEANTSHGR